MQVEAYTAIGVATGHVSQSGGPREGLEGFGMLVVADGAWYPLDGSAPRSVAEQRLAADDIIVVALEDDPDVPVHATWHPILLEAGPFTVTGELPTQPGFDPGRALTRPAGTFLMLRDVKVELRDRPNMGEVDRPFALVNRFAIDRVAADLTLGFYFPGARLETPQGAPA
jgi:hypothetical protein